MTNTQKERTRSVPLVNHSTTPWQLSGPIRPQSSDPRASNGETEMGSASPLNPPSRWIEITNSSVDPDPQPQPQTKPQTQTEIEAQTQLQTTTEPQKQSMRPPVYLPRTSTSEGSGGLVLLVGWSPALCPAVPAEVQRQFAQFKLIFLCDEKAEGEVTPELSTLDASVEYTNLDDHECVEQAVDKIKDTHGSPRLVVFFTTPTPVWIKTKPSVIDAWLRRSVGGCMSAVQAVIAGLLADHEACFLVVKSYREPLRQRQSCIMQGYVDALAKAYNIRIACVSLPPHSNEGNALPSTPVLVATSLLQLLMQVDSVWNPWRTALDLSDTAAHKANDRSR